MYSKLSPSNASFRVLAYPYRNRRSRLGLRFNLIAAIFNLELSKKYLLMSSIEYLISINYLSFMSPLPVAL